MGGGNKCKKVRIPMATTRVVMGNGNGSADNRNDVRMEIIMKHRRKTSEIHYLSVQPGLIHPEDFKFLLDFTHFL